eukprot:PhF_6_TR25529/c0_g1_i1/m.35730
MMMMMTLTPKRLRVMMVKEVETSWNCMTSQSHLYTASTNRMKTFWCSATMPLIQRRWRNAATSSTNMFSVLQDVTVVSSHNSMVGTCVFCLTVPRTFPATPQLRFNLHFRFWRGFIRLLLLLRSQKKEPAAPNNTVKVKTWSLSASSPPR